MTRASEVVSSAFALFRARETRVRIRALFSFLRFSFFFTCERTKRSQWLELDVLYRCIRHKISGITAGTRRAIFLY